MMEPMSEPRRTDQTADRLLHMLHQYPAGAKLPGEPGLCKLFGVSRTTLREAVRFLAAQGYLEVRRGSGTFVLDRPEIDIGLSSLEGVQARLQDLFEIRLMIEPPTAKLACIRGSEQEIAEIIRCSEEVTQAIHENRDFSRQEESFHQAFVAAAHNPFLEQLLPVIHNALEEAWEAVDARSSLAQSTLEDNPLLLSFLRQRDGDGVQLAMAAHIRHTIHLLHLRKDIQR